jgi:ribonuclease Y
MAGTFSSAEWLVNLLLFAAAVLASTLAQFLWRRRQAAVATRHSEDAHREAREIVHAAKAEVEKLLVAARQEAQDAGTRRREQREKELAHHRATLKQTSVQLESWEATVRRSETQLQARTDALSAREAALLAHAERQKGAQTAQKQSEAAAQKRLQELAGESFREARQRLISEWAEQVRAEGAERVRQVDQTQTSPEISRQARRLLDIASQRYHGHYLTERLLSTIHIQPEVAEQIAGADASGLELIGEVANVKLSLAEDRTSIRLEGQDSFGREIARRAIARFTKQPPRGSPDNIRRVVTLIAEELERETIELGRKAFRELQIPRAHPDIVRLVGRLNFRTSYSQNQWKHAIEAAFLCGMMAAELRLDVKIARRAALMHDIGKSLTHAIDGSHAVIGADFARRLGESETVANAIGAHHLDEPFNSSYALLVAASDAMSGARPGARHEQEGSYVQRLEDLERLITGIAGIERVYALQAGRELRVHVKEAQVDDLRAAQLSSELAAHISANLVFPGQIKVTVIRELTAVAVAN